MQLHQAVSNVFVQLSATLALYPRSNMFNLVEPF
jgi:hypothetical protein